MRRAQGVWHCECCGKRGAELNQKCEPPDQSDEGPELRPGDEPEDHNATGKFLESCGPCVQADADFPLRNALGRSMMWSGTPLTGWPTGLAWTVSSTVMTLLIVMSKLLVCRGLG